MSVICQVNSLLLIVVACRWLCVCQLLVEPENIVTPADGDFIACIANGPKTKTIETYRILRISVVVTFRLVMQHHAVHVHLGRYAHCSGRH